MLSVLDGPLSGASGAPTVRVPDIRRLAMRDWPAFLRVGEEIVRGERAMADAASGVHACALVLASSQSVWPPFSKTWPLLSWKIHAGILRHAVIRVLDFGGDEEAAARNSDLGWCIRAHAGHLRRFVWTMNENPMNGHIWRWTSAEQGLLEKVFDKWFMSGIIAEQLRPPRPCYF